MTEILGLPLPLALQILESDPIIVETAPPLVPKNRVPLWGESRVLRVRDREGHLELLVARELLSEDTPVSSPPQSL